MQFSFENLLADREIVRLAGGPGQTGSTLFAADLTPGDSQMDWIVLFWLVAGLALLVAGADVMVRGASRLALGLGISPLVVGLTIVAYGTSAPELAVSLRAAVAGNGQIVLGNVIGSNIVNVLLILGASALIVPLSVQRRIVRLEVPLMLGVSVLTWVFAADGMIGRVEGFLLLFGAMLYTGFVLVQSRRETASAAGAIEAGPAEYQSSPETGQNGGGGVLVSLLLVLAGLACLVLGARWLVEAATTIARTFGMSDLLIGLTVVAIGTSFPELATSIVAALRGERDMAVGNIVGSNLFNLLFVLGTSSLVLPVSVAYHAISVDLPVMFAAAFACLPIFFTGYRIDRWEGSLFLAFYGLYIAYLIAAALGKTDWISLQISIALFVAPLTVLTLIATSIHAWSKGSDVRS
ncbi:MAG: calcium/sodium antiporter [Leptospirales bacterium]